MANHPTDHATEQEGDSALGAEARLMTETSARQSGARYA